MKKEIQVVGCFHSCPFFGSTMDGMVCNHYYWKDKEAFSEMIITNDNSKDGNIPEKCPLKIEQIEVTYKLKYNK